MATKAKVVHLIVDSGAFIKNVNLSDRAENIYTIHDVVTEIRDKATRQRLQVLPYDLIFREPTTESIKTVSEFAKKTGDYASLSAVDIRLLALGYQLEKEHVGTDHLRTEPNRTVTWVSPDQVADTTAQVAGFYLKQKKNSNQDPVVAEEMPSETGSDDPPSTITEPSDKPATITDAGDKSTESSRVAQLTIVPSEQGTNETVDNKMDENDDDDDDDYEDTDDDDDDNDDDDGGGWITPGNLAAVNKSMAAFEVAQPAVVQVACMTTDFAMQNVLIQMGLQVVSVDGLVIKQARSYVLRCFGCFKVTKDMSKTFCYNCGNATLRKTSVSVNSDGSMQFYLSRRKNISTRGLRYSLPLPKGGKHTSNPILCEDQREAHRRPSKSSKVKYDAFDPDFTAFNSPFAPTDTHSRAAIARFNHKHAHFNAVADSKNNPNENRKVYGRRK